MSLVFHIVFAVFGIGMPLLMVLADGLSLVERYVRDVPIA